MGLLLIKLYKSYRECQKIRYFSIINIKQKSQQNTIQMSFYLTPTKPQNKKSGQTHSQDKPTDWICMVCNNLNFSFRKKCNRCKTQTRVQNQNQMANAYSQYYLSNMSYMSAPKNALSDLTNCHTSEPRSQRTVGSKAEEASKLLPQPIDFKSSILDIECWQKIKSELTEAEEEMDKKSQLSKKNQNISEQQREPSVCEFTDLEIEFLVSRVLEENC